MPGLGELPERFWKHVAYSPGCWFWTGPSNSGGRGRIMVGKRRSYAHRLVCRAVYGDAPKDQPDVVRSCGEITCVNPIHLSWGVRSPTPKTEVYYEGPWKNTRLNQLPKRFWDKVRYSPGCWEWVGGKNGSGLQAYGRFRPVQPLRSRKNSFAHREVCLLVHNRPPQGKPFVLHSCDNPSCVNPDHLRWGDAADNAADRESRGRGVRVGKSRKLQAGSTVE